MMVNEISKRIDWLDQLKGFGIILVVYGHNFPAVENYIYSFHMPLFFFIAGIFHPKKINQTIIKKRAIQILAPYFLWSIFLYLFWVFIGKNFGESLERENDIFKNFIGIFFAQGDYEYMGWGIPMWFLPSIFLTFLIFGFILKIPKKNFQLFILIGLITTGFLIPKMYSLSLFWSLDVSLVSLSFYGFGFYLKEFNIKKDQQNKWIWLSILFVIHVLISFFLISKTDMYRSIYRNEFIFLVSALLGIYFWLFCFKYLINLKFFSFFGKNTLIVLALHLRTMTFIKGILSFGFGYAVFSFTEIEKILLVFLQLALLYLPIIYINKYLPILNGKKQ